MDFDLSLDLRKAGSVTGVAAVAAGAVVAFAPGAGAASTDDFARLRVCESGNNYAENTGNGYYGAYQFEPRTWRGLGYTGLPSNASPAVQDQAAQRLQAARGWEPWPGCSRKLGLGSGTPVVVGASSGRAVVIAHSSSRRAKVLPQAAPAFDGITLTSALVKQKRADVITWQQRMRARGWSIAVDGYFGPQSARTAASFAAEKHIASGVGGAVGAAMWSAPWTLPVT